MTTETAAPISYAIYSAELAPYAPDLPEDPPEWTADMEATLRAFADGYADALRSALAEAFPGRRVEVEVHHNVTGAGSGSTWCEPEDREAVTEVANRVLESMSEPA